MASSSTKNTDSDAPKESDKSSKTSTDNERSKDNETNDDKDSDASREDESSKKSNDNDGSSISGGIGKTLTYMAILVGFLACLIGVAPLIGPKILKQTGIAQTEMEAKAYFDWSNFDWETFLQDLQQHTTPSERPGFKLAQEGATAKYPLVLIPGFTTSGLEVWGTEECGRKYFRTRFWGTMDQAKALLADVDCWRRHMTLHPFTGGDPSPTIRLRPTEGMQAGDYFMAPYWVWGKLIQNFNDVGYDPSNMAMMSYDWRLPNQITEKRDGYLTRIKLQVEAFHERHGERVIIMGHSMAGTVVHYFFQWVTTPQSEGGGGGGADWVDKHVETYVNIAGALLGVPKAVAALMSGEMKDTSDLIGTVGDIAESYFGRKLRKDMFATWGALWAMLPKGGNAVWNTVLDGEEYYPMLTLTDPNTNITDDDLKNVSDNEAVRKKIMEFASKQNHTVNDLLDFLLTWGSGYGPEIAAGKFLKFQKQTDEELAQEHWHDATITPLPEMSSTKIYCLYGVGAETEVGYYYKTSWGGYEGEEGGKCSDDKCDPPFLLNATVNNEEEKVAYGVRSGDGDATVPAVSMGYPCVGAWATKKLNPSGAKVITREYKDKSVFQVNDPLRGGPEAAIHIDILGNCEMTENIVRIITDFGIENVEQRVISNMEELSKKINEKMEIE